MGAWLHGRGGNLHVFFERLLMGIASLRLLSCF